MAKSHCNCKTGVYVSFVGRLLPVSHCCVSIPFQGMGLDSHDDRAMFKKEVKVLKPFADKQRKAMEKLKKEEKKNAKKRKK